MRGKITRRRAVATVGSLAIALGGCQGVLDSGGDQRTTEGGTEDWTVTESFESGFESSIFEDDSQREGRVRVTPDHAAHGDRALRLASDPGTSSSSRAVTASTWTGPHRFTAAIKPLVVGGPENSFGLRLQGADGERAVSVNSSHYYEGTRVQEVDENGEQLQDRTVEVGPPLGEGSWVRFDVATSSLGLEVSMGDSTTTVDTEWTVVDDPVELRLKANGWGNGHPVAVAVDDVRIGPR